VCVCVPLNSPREWSCSACAVPPACGVTLGRVRGAGKALFLAVVQEDAHVPPVSGWPARGACPDNAVDVTSIVPQGVQGWSWFSCKKTNTCHK